MTIGFVDTHHDHGQCLSDAVARAEARCAQTGKKLTDMRRRVLEIVWQAHQPISAYQIMDVLREDGRRVQPPTVYRALEFFTDLKLMHRIESLNAYLGCSGIEKPGETTEFFICRTCRRVAERMCPDAMDGLKRAAAEMNFTIERPVIEVVGICPECAGSAD